MGCNTSKETTNNENDNKESKEEGARPNDEVNHVETDLSAEDRKSSSAKTITIRSNGTLVEQQKKVENIENSAEEAATKIQAVFRGHRTRKSMKQPQTQPQEHEPTREELENEFRLDDPELCNAATKIQASFRGHMTRKQMEEEKKGDEPKNNEGEEELDIDLTDPELNKAAAKIQASFRGHLKNKEGQGDGQTSSN
ncbi:hypothetical protein ABEB36_000747 [Hypothenemus hampei]|uniref:Neuromodulin n=1 Tax=Hypothenemus hampei TaxID=57062 RepID=A0ABD1FCA1_HYPHA